MYITKVPSIYTFPHSEIIFICSAKPLVLKLLITQLTANCIFLYLTLYRTILTFHDLRKKAFEDILRKEENARNQHFLPFPTMFSSFPKINFKFSVAFDLSSANTFNLDMSKILLFGRVNS